MELQVIILGTSYLNYLSKTGNYYNDCLSFIIRQGSQKVSDCHGGQATTNN